MEESNGPLRGPVKMNGMNNSVNGAIKTQLNGHPGVPRRRATREGKGPGFLTQSFGIVARLLTWYSIITILFRCPATLDHCTESSPAVCKPYFQLKQAVSPTLEPYYDAYAAPYVELVQPYYNTLDRTVIAPAWGYAAKYGAPQILQAQAYSRVQWEKNIQPQLAKYLTLARAQYDQKLAPHVSRAAVALEPYLDIARTNALQTYHEQLLPSYEFVQPYILQGYGAAFAFATETAIPVATSAWNTTYVFLDGTVWPQLRVLYVETVEPQLVKIGQRLGRYNGKTPKSALESVSSTMSKAASSFTKPTSSVSVPPASATSSARSEEYTEPEATFAPAVDDDADPTFVDDEPVITPAARVGVVEPPDDEGPIDEARRKAKIVVAEDLKDWQERYAKAADDGAAEIEDQVDEISKRMIRRQARIIGKPLVEALKISTAEGLVSLQNDIVAIIEATNAGSMTPGKAQEDLVTSVRRVGLQIKEKAQEVRTWREKYEDELHTSVTQAAESHFKILDGIRDLALQKIGMKWAWTDGVTYRDWAKYHQLKGRFDEWQGDLEKLIITHPGLEAAQNEGNAIESEAMDIASAAAKELGRLKQVGVWKLAARDASYDFDSETTRLAAEAAAAAKAAQDTTAEKVDEAVEPASGAASKVASSIFEPMEEVTATAGSVASGISEDVSGSVEETSLPYIQSLASEASSAASSASLSASSIVGSIFGTPSSESSATDTTETSTDLASEASPIILAETPIIVGNTSESTEPGGPAPVEPPLQELPTSSVKPAFMGAAAQSAPSRVPILDDDADAVESKRVDIAASISSVAQSAYSVAISHANEQYSAALSIVSAQMKGTPKPVHGQMLASVTSAYSQALASASSRLDSVVRVAQDRLAGTLTTQALPSLPSLDWSSIEAIAAERLNQGRLWAEEQYESAKIAIGLATPTPSTPSEHVDRMLQNAKHNYYAGLGVAHARYSEFMAAASSAFSAVTATPTPTDLAGTVSSVASVASESAASVASAASENISSAASVVSENISSAAQAGYDNIAAAPAAVQENWDYVVSKISVQVYGAPTPTPWYHSVYSAAGEYAASATDGYNSVYSAAGEYAASATDAAAHHASSVTSAAGTYASAASDEAARQYSSVSSLLSELLYGKEPSFSESVYSRLSAAYVTGVKSAESMASAVSETIVSAASEATDKMKESFERAKDEL